MAPLVYCNTVSVVDPLTEFMVAVMLVVPALALEATPFVLMVATAGAEGAPTRDNPPLPRPLAKSRSPVPHSSHFAAGAPAVPVWPRVADR